MSAKHILLVDGSTLRQPFLSDVLQDAGQVNTFEQPQQAITAVKKGLDVDVAVIHYRLSLTPLIQTLRHQRPNAKIVAFGAPRTDTPLGVDQYLNQPILGAELRGVVERFAAKTKAN